MSTLLLFNIEDETKRTAIRLLSMRLGFSYIDVPPSRQGMTVSELLKREEGEKRVLSPFTDEMMVMYAFPSQSMHALLDTMRNNGCPVRLKCVVTETNKSWAAERLHREIAAEEQNMRKRRK
ncbi:MAG: DUF3783 domain-containing protein [Oscillospiraceae bacterium]|nr:DUF3783 domain-containing protein [Oscillospiraceae bacterium]